MNKVLLWCTINMQLTLWSFKFHPTKKHMWVPVNKDLSPPTMTHPINCFSTMSWKYFKLQKLYSVALIFAYIPKLKIQYMHMYYINLQHGHECGSQKQVQSRSVSHDNCLEYKYQGVQNQLHFLMTTANACTHTQKQSAGVDIHRKEREGRVWLSWRTGKQRESREWVWLQFKEVQPRRKS